MSRGEDQIMCGIKLRIFSLPTALLMLALTVSDAAGRELGAELEGTELLIECAKSTASDGIPGIYAMNSDGDVQLVIRYGRNPTWGPNRRQFCYSLFGHTWLADLDQKLVRQLDMHGMFYDYFPSFWEPRSKLSPISWLPDSTGIVRWLPIPYGFTPMLMNTTGKGHASGVVLPRPRMRAIGRYSFDASGKRCAFETARLLPAFGCSDREVFIQMKPDTEAVPLTLPFNTNALLNPLCEPGNSRLAVDYLDEKNRRHCIVSELDSMKQWQRVPLEKPWNKGLWGCTAGVEWAPSGERLLVKVFRSSDAADTDETGAVIHFPQGGEPVWEFSLVGFGRKVQMRWSPDEKHIAALVSSFPFNTEYDFVDILVYTLSQNAKEAPEVDGRGVRLPEGLCPVSIDW